MNQPAAVHRVVSLALVGMAGALLLGALASLQAPAAAHLYVAAGAGGLRVVDVGDPTNPSEVGATHDLSPTVALAVQEEYAYLAGDHAGLAIVDVGDPFTPTLVARLDVTGTDIAVFGDVAYVVNSSALVLLDVARPDRPLLLGDLQSGASAVAVDGRYAYLAAALGLTVVDVTDPATPQPVGLFLGRAEDAAVAQHGVVVVGPLYGLRVVSVRPPETPASLGGVELSGHPRSVVVEGDTAYVAATTSAGGEPGGLHIVDIAEPAAASLIATYPGSFEDVVVRAGRAYLARQDGTIEIVDVETPGVPRPVGELAAPWRAMRVALAWPRPIVPPATETPTATVPWTLTATATPTALTTATTPAPTTEATTTATRTATVPATVTPTATRPVPTPLPTRLPGRAWRQFTTSNAPLVSNDIRHVSTDGEGTAWLRVFRGLGQPDAVVAAVARGAWRAFANLRQAVSLQAATVSRIGTLDGFWAVDDAGHIWIGAEYFDGRRWQVKGLDEWAPEGWLRLEQDLVLDRLGQIWVPYTTRTACLDGLACRTDGLRPFAFEGRRNGDVVLATDPTALRRRVPAVRLLNVSIAGRSVGGWAVAQRALYPLPQPSGVPYPVILDIAMSPRLRTSGHATAACLQADGRPTVFTWVEQHRLDPASRRVISYHVYENRFLGQTWASPTDLADAPLFPNGVAEDWVAAAACLPTGERWLASASGHLAAQDRAGQWVDHFTPAEIGLPEGAYVWDLAIGRDGTLWLATNAGLFAYGEVEPATSVWGLYLPVVRRD